MIVPIIHGCRVQKYGYSPGSFGIAIGLLLWPGGTRLVSNLPSGVASCPDVAVCIAVSSFFQVIVSPAFAVASAGTKNSGLLADWEPFAMEIVVPVVAP